jgi:hypothetical protein
MFDLARFDLRIIRGVQSSAPGGHTAERGAPTATLAGARTTKVIMPAIEPDDRIPGVGRREISEVAASRCRRNVSPERDRPRQTPSLGGFLRQQGTTGTLPVRLGMLLSAWPPVPAGREKQAAFEAIRLPQIVHHQMGDWQRVVRERVHVGVVSGHRPADVAANPMLA